MLACAGLFLSFAQQSNAATSAIISLGNAGAFISVNSTSSPTWNFHWNGDTNYSFDSADFQLGKDGGMAAGETIEFSLYDSYGGAAGGGTNLIPGTYLTAAQVTGSTNTFTFSTAINPLAAGDYSVVLSSTVTAKNFKVKPGSFQINVDPSLYTTDGNTTGTSAPAPVPETSSSIMAAVGVLGMLSFRRRNKAA